VMLISGEWGVEGPWPEDEAGAVLEQARAPSATLGQLEAMDVIMSDPLLGPSVPALTSALAMPSLHRLRVTTLLDEDASPFTRDSFTRALLPLAQSLKSLEIRGASHWTDRTLWDHTLLWAALPLLPKLEDLVLDAFMDAPAGSDSDHPMDHGHGLEHPPPPLPSVKRILVRGYFESLYWSVQVYSYEECMARLSSSLRSLLGPTFPGLKLVRFADLEPWSPRTQGYRDTFRRWAMQMEVTERFTRFPTEEYEAVAREVMQICRKRGVRVEDRFGDEGDLERLAPVEWCWPQYITDLYRVAGAIV